LVNQDLQALFKNWIRDYQGTVLKVARAYTLTFEDCQDLAQEILLQVWRSLPNYQHRSSPSTWMYRVALNTALSWHRDAHRRPWRRRDLVTVEELPASGIDAFQNATQKEAVERLYAAIRRLPKTDAALVLMYLDDLSYREIGDVLGISENAVGVKLNRLKKELTELMTEAPHE
jgi:RNA polymerase sigma-70 factor (ECF subfamily)